MGFALAEGFGRGFDTFWQIVKNGDFDRILLRPLSAMVQVASREVQLMRLGRLVQGFSVLVWGFLHLGFSFFSHQALIIFLAIFGTSCLFYGLFVIQAAISFWTVESLELMNITTYGGGEAGQYPLSAYATPFKLFFTFIVPIGCVAFYPIATLLHHETFPLFVAFLLPMVGVLFLLVARGIWHCGVRHYSSTGS